MIPLRATSSLLLLGFAGACSSDCPQGQLPAEDRQGTRRQCIDETTTSDDTTTDDSSSGNPVTTMPPPCDDDPACGPNEDLNTCPEQCSVCGDGILSGDEVCDLGPANKTYWPTTPPADACSELCTTLFEWCGDDLETNNEPCDNGSNIDPDYNATMLPSGACAPGCVLPGYCGDNKLNGNEPCDNGSNIDPDYAVTPPPAGACAPGCITPGHCGDATINGNEQCDDAAQTATCELTCVAPACGDGIHNPQAGEACDDANTVDGDGCSADCNSIERLVFVSSATYFGDLNKADNDPENLSGLALADYRCQTLAAAADLPGTYKAWLSTATESPSTRFDTRFTGLYRLTSKDFPIIAEGWQGLISGTLLHPIDAFETGSVVQTDKKVWTNTLPHGTRTSELDCSAWTANDNTTTAVGESIASGPTWTNLGSGQFCSEPRSLYCFQDV